MQMKRIYGARDEVEAHLVRGLLESEGIAAEVRGEAMGWVRGMVPVAQSGPSVWVAPQDVERAELIVEQFRRGERRVARPPWHCPQCGEKIEGQFTHCWHCGAVRPDMAEEEA